MADLEADIEAREKQRRRARQMERVGAENGSPGAAFSARKSADALPWGPGAASAYSRRAGRSHDAISASAIPASLLKSAAGALGLGAHRLPLSRAFGGARGGVRGTLASASAGGKNAGHRTGVPGSNAKPPTGMEGTTREETLRELRRRRAVIDSQTARLDELAARDKKEASSRGSSPGTSLASFSPVRRIPAFHTPGGGGESPGTPRGMSPGTTPGTPGTRGPAVSAFHTPFSSAGSDAGSEEGRAIASPVGGRRLAAPSDLDPAEENAVVRAVLSRISGPRATSTVKKQKPRAAEDEDADAGDAPADDAPLAFAAVPPPVSKAETETEPPKPAAGGATPHCPGRAPCPWMASSVAATAEARDWAATTAAWAAMAAGATWAVRPR